MAFWPGRPFRRLQGSTTAILKADTQSKKAFVTSFPSTSNPCKKQSYPQGYPQVFSKLWITFEFMHPKTCKVKLWITMWITFAETGNKRKANKENSLYSLGFDPYLKTVIGGIIRGGILFFQKKFRLVCHKDDMTEKECHIERLERH